MYYGVIGKTLIKFSVFGIYISTKVGVHLYIASVIYRPLCYNYSRYYPVTPGF